MTVLMTAKETAEFHLANCRWCDVPPDFDVLGVVSIDAFRITNVRCPKCGYTVFWHESATKDALALWNNIMTKVWPTQLQFCI